MVNLVPTDCPELPGNEKIKEEMAKFKAKKREQRLKKGGGAAESGCGGMRGRTSRGDDHSS